MSASESRYAKAAREVSDEWIRAGRWHTPPDDTSGVDEIAFWDEVERRATAPQEGFAEQQLHPRDGMTNPVTAAREVVATKQPKELDGFLLDLPTANAILTVADALSDESRAKLEALTVAQAAAVCWRVVE